MSICYDNDQIQIDCHDRIILIIKNQGIFRVIQGKRGNQKEKLILYAWPVKFEEYTTETVNTIVMTFNFFGSNGEIMTCICKGSTSKDLTKCLRKFKLHNDKNLQALEADLNCIINYFRKTNNNCHQAIQTQLTVEEVIERLGKYITKLISEVQERLARYGVRNVDVDIKELIFLIYLWSYYYSIEISLALYART